MSAQQYAGFSSPLTNIESAVFGALMLRPGTYFSGRDLIDVVGGLEPAFGERLAQVGVSGLIRSIAQKVDASAPEYPIVLHAPGQYLASYSSDVPSPRFQSMIVEFGDGYTLNREGKKVTKGDGEIHLAHQEFLALEALVLNEGIVLSNDELLAVIQSKSAGGTKVIMRRIRNKIDPEKKFIRTRRGFGYVYFST